MKNFEKHILKVSKNQEIREEKKQKAKNEVENFQSLTSFTSKTKEGKIEKEKNVQNNEKIPNLEKWWGVKVFKKTLKLKSLFSQKKFIYS